MSGPYRTIVADPPWQYEGGAFTPTTPGDTRNKGVECDYPTMPLDEICALDVASLADPDGAHLYLWFTNKTVEAAYTVARAWGFDPKVPLTWVKTRADDPTRASMKVGYYFRGATEHCLFAVRGKLRLQARRGLPTGFMWPRMALHSAKPDAFYDMVEEASPGPYLEMFSRRARLGWDTWGDQALAGASTFRAPEAGS